MSAMWSPEILAIISATFVLAGFVKGVIGLGLPTIVLGLLTATVGLKEAMALMLIPYFVTNVWQALAEDSFRIIVLRLWPLFVSACIVIWFGVGVLAQTDSAWLSALLGILLCVYSALSLLTPPIPPPGRWERWLSPAVGIVNGLLTGLTGSFVVPGPCWHSESISYCASCYDCPGCRAGRGEHPQLGAARVNQVPWKF